MANMSKPKAAAKKLSDFKPDPQNLNKHTARGGGMMEQSIGECGYGDSMTATADGVIISGNQRAETCFGAGLDNPIIVESDGTRPVIHVRTDLKSGDERAVKLGIFQNRVGETNLDWDAAALQELQAQDFDLSDFWRDDELAALLSGVESGNGTGGGEEAPPVVPSQMRVQVGDVFGLGRQAKCPKCGKATDV